MKETKIMEAHSYRCWKQKQMATSLQLRANLCGKRPPMLQCSGFSIMPKRATRHPGVQSMAVFSNLSLKVETYQTYAEPP